MWAQPYAQPSIFQIKTEPSTRSQYFFPFLANKPARYFRFSRSIKIQPATLFKARYTACELINNGARACSARKRKARSKIPLTAITTPPRADRVIGRARIEKPNRPARCSFPRQRLCKASRVSAGAVQPVSAVLE